MKHIDILLGNEKEFEALGESVLPPVAVKTLGANGVDVRSQGKWQHFQPLKVENVVNTTAPEMLCRRFSLCREPRYAN